MRRITAICLFVYLLIFAFLAPSASAGSFSEAFLRLDRTKANTALTGTVCAKPSSGGAGTESKVTITFPSDFIISTSASNHTTSTSNLPSGATVWPSIESSANSVSGQSVTFSSGDLTSASTLYCFNFLSSSSSTGSSGNSKTGTIATKNSSDSAIDSSEYAVSIVSNDQILVSGRVPASASDYSAVISKLNPSTQFSENSEIEYRITYGNTLSYNAAITVQASWSLGTIDGQSSPTVDVLNYAARSGGNAYGASVPVIDSVNRTISWTISSFPGGTSNQTVNFKLRTTSNYTGTHRVSYIVSAKIIFLEGETAGSESTAYYRHSTADPASSASVSPTPTPTEVKPLIQLIEVREISNKSAKIFVQTTTETRKIIRYGKLLSNLSQSKSSDFTKNSVITLDNLTPDSTYFFRVTAFDRKNNQTSSDIFTFKTSKKAPIAELDKDTLTITSGENILNSPKIKDELSDKNKYVVVPENSTFKFKFSIKGDENVKNVKVFVRERKLLGIRIGFNEALANTDSVQLIEIEPGSYEGTLLTKPDEENYEIIAQITDLNGNITEQKVADLRVINKFSVKNKKGEPIEGARVLFYLFNQKSKTYQIVPSESIKGGNPLFTGNDGKIDLALPKAKYRASINILGYKDQEVKFEIGEKEGQSFPIIVMEKSPVTLERIIRYYARGFLEVFIPKTYFYFSELSKSIRIFDLVTFLSLSFLVFFTFIAFSKKHHIPLSSMASYFYYLLDHKKSHDKYITGVVFDEDDGPIPSANVYITDAESEEIVGRAKTNKRGEFFWKKQSNNNYLIMVMAKGFNTSPLIPFKEKEHLKFRIDLAKKHQGLNIFENAVKVISSVIGMVFEGLMVLTLIFEVLFIFNFGFIKTLPFLSLSIFNLLVWTLHLRHRHAAAQY